MTPAEHYKEADRLLSSLSDDQFGLPFARARVAAAHAHAVLASCGYIEFDDGGDASHNGYVAAREEVVAKVTGDRL